jgi:hypothetical protein
MSLDDDDLDHKHGERKMLEQQPEAPFHLSNHHFNRRKPWSIKGELLQKSMDK